MKKEFIKFAALSLAAVVSMSILTACGNGQNSTGGSEKTETTDTAGKTDSGDKNKDAAPEAKNTENK